MVSDLPLEILHLAEAVLAEAEKLSDAQSMAFQTYAGNTKTGVRFCWSTHVEMDWVVDL